MEPIDRLIEILCEERGEPAPKSTQIGKQNLFRALCNIRPPKPASKEFIALQDEYLTKLNRERGIVDVQSLNFVGGVALWQGDITRLNCGAIVNACNSALLGCFTPLHSCIDNCIHSFAGVQVRLDCANIMKGGEEECGQVKVTRAYNLPCGYIFHTVGPQVYGNPTTQNEKDLASCYNSCLDMARRMELESIALCCISTGVYGYPKRDACKVAIREAMRNKSEKLKIIFCVYSDEDYAIYKDELDRYFKGFTE